MELMNKARILVTYASVYDMPAEVGRDAMKGCSVHYFFLGENGEEFAPVVESDVAKPVGYQRAKVSLDYAMRAKIPAAPAIYDGEFKMTLGSDGKPVAKLVDLEFVSTFDFDLGKLNEKPGAPASGATEKTGKDK
jgi:hypothetical protein